MIKGATSYFKVTMSYTAMPRIVSGVALEALMQELAMHGYIGELVSIEYSHTDVPASFIETLADNGFAVHSSFKSI
jgi:hypothetical protein